MNEKLSKEGLRSNLTADWQTWIALAKDDIQGSRVLLEQNLHRNSYFLFQQASEKAVKALALFQRHGTEKDIEDMRHDQFKLVRRTIVKKLGMLDDLIASDNGSSKNSERFFKIRQEITGCLCYIDSIKNMELVNMTDEDLDLMIKSIDESVNARRDSTEVKKLAEYLLFENTSWWESLKSTSGAKLRERIYEIRNDKDNRARFEGAIRLLFWLEDLTYVYLCIYSCALLTVQHSSKTRYPVTGHDPLNVYTSRLPIVNRQLYFLGKLEKAVDLISYLSEEDERIASLIRITP